MAARKDFRPIYMGTGGGVRGHGAKNKYYKKIPMKTVTVKGKTIRVRKERISAKKFQSETGDKYRSMSYYKRKGRGRKNQKGEGIGDVVNTIKKLSKNSLVKKGLGKGLEALANNTDRIADFAAGKIKNKAIKGLLNNKSARGFVKNQLNKATKKYNGSGGSIRDIRTAGEMFLPWL